MDPICPPHSHNSVIDSSKATTGTQKRDNALLSQNGTAESSKALEGVVFADD